MSSLDETWREFRRWQRRFDKRIEREARSRKRDVEACAHCCGVPMRVARASVRRTGLWVDAYAYRDTVERVLREKDAP